MRALLVAILAWLIPALAFAQFPYNESCKNVTAPGFVISGSAKLTAAASLDPAGAGYLRLTDNTLNNVGYAYAQAAFPSNYGLTTSFEFFSWKTGATSTNQADGMTFFLFDASVNSFRPGGIGGALGYAQYYGTPGIAKGYIGISIDEFGNFSNPADGSKNGGPGQQRGSVAIRGPGNGKSTSDYVYQTGVIASDPSYNAGFQGFTQRYFDAANVNYRKLKVVLTPGSSAGASVGYKVTVIMYKGGATLTPVTLINNFDYPYAAPAKLQFGFAASTGSISNYHEIRNINVDVTNTGALLAPTGNNDAVTIACQGQTTLIDVTANDVSNNAGGSINRATVDLDPVTPDIQATYSDPGKGVYTVDAKGIVSFVPAVGFSGTSTAAYTVSDTYGATTAAASTISVNVNNSAAPVLVLTDPSAVCAPATIDLTSSSWKLTTAPGASFTYFATLNDANSGSNALAASASAINQSGTYYIKEMLAGCATIKPITVQINAAPTTAYAGSDQTYCSSAGGQSATLLATNPDIGAGAWTQVSGPSSASINYPEAATTLVSNMAKGVYTFRWTTTSTGCAASLSDIKISVGIASVAGSAQTLCNASGVTLAANPASPGVGAWTQVSGATTAVFSDAANPSASVSGLLPGNTYGFQWKIVNGGCNSSSIVNVTSLVNTVANAGSGRVIGLASSFPLLGNTPEAGNTGAWTIISQPALSAVVLSNPGSPTPNVTAVSILGDYNFRWTISNGGCSNYSDVTIRVSTALPARLLSFKAIKESSQMIQLVWTTANERADERFEVERSEDGLTFVKIGTVNGADSLLAANRHSYQDNITSVQSTTVFYRLKQLDPTGAFSYSSIISIDLNVKTQATVLSNPFSDQIKMRIQVPLPTKYTFQLYDSRGNLIKVVERSLNKGLNLITLNGTGHLAAGIYWLKLASSDSYQTIQLLKP